MRAVPRRWVMFSLFLSSYTPLFALVGVRSIGHSAAITIASGLLILSGVVGTTLFLATAPRKARRGYRLVEVEGRDADVAAYAATYLLPFLTVFTGDWQDVASLAAFIVLLGLLYVRTRLIYVNPVLALMGWHLWRVLPTTLDSGRGGRVGWPRFLLADTRLIRADQEKLEKVARGGIWREPVATLKKYSEQYGLTVEWGSDGGLVFDDSFEKQWEILKLLDEDRTRGPVSGRKYESSAKRRV